MAKEILFENDAYTPLLRGIKKNADFVGSTLGPEGRTVILSERYHGKNKITKDGVTASKSLILKDELENVGNVFMQEIAEKAVEYSGDATTTATVEGAYLITEGLKHVLEGKNPQEIKRGIEKSVENICATLKEISTPVTDADNNLLLNVARTSANGDNEIGELIAGAFSKIGNAGRLSIENSKTGKSYVDTPEGIEMPRGFLHPIFVTDMDKMITYYQEPRILIYDFEITNFVHKTEDDGGISSTIQELLMDSNRPIILIARDFNGEAFHTLAKNYSTIDPKSGRRNLDICLIKAPTNYTSEWIEDIAAFTGAKVISDINGMRIEDAALEHCGSCESITAKYGTTLFVSGAGSKETKETQKNKIKQIGETQQDEGAKEHQLQRLATFSGSISSIYVGGATELELKEKKDRVDDAVRAVKSAIEEGVIVGGGIGLLRCIKNLANIKTEGDEYIGVLIVADTCQAPLKKMLENACLPVDLFDKIYNGEIDKNAGYNIKTKNFENLFETGVLDAIKVVRCALVSAASVACGVITSKGMAVEMLPR